MGSAVRQTDSEGPGGIVSSVVMVIVKDIIIAHVRHAVCTLDSYTRFTNAIGGINLSKNRKWLRSAF